MLLVVNHRGQIYLYVNCEIVKFLNLVCLHVFADIPYCCPFLLPTHKFVLFLVFEFSLEVLHINYIEGKITQIWWANDEGIFS
jgi:hypothetical protein